MITALTEAIARHRRRSARPSWLADAVADALADEGADPAQIARWKAGEHVLLHEMFNLRDYRLPRREPAWSVYLRCTECGIPLQRDPLCSDLVVMVLHWMSEHPARWLELHPEDAWFLAPMGLDTEEKTMGDSNDMPPEPFSDLAAASTQLHELFMSYVDAGFTRTEALQIIIGLIRPQPPVT